MGRFVDLTGKKFHRLTVIHNIGKDKGGNYLWLCKCDCGKETIVRSDNLKYENTRSCGCLRKINKNMIL